MTKIAEEAAIPYPTACRIVGTLIHEGVVEAEPARKRYRVTELVLSLSSGYQTENHLVAVARPLIEKLCHQLHWPIALTTRVGNRIMVRDSTHSITSLTFSNYYPGHTLPIAECASGKAYLSHCDKDELDEIDGGWDTQSDETAVRGKAFIQNEAELTKIRNNGFALQTNILHTADPGKTSAIAVPVNDENGKILGALVLIYFANALKQNEVIENFLPSLQMTSSKILDGMSRKKLTQSQDRLANHNA